MFYRVEFEGAVHLLDSKRRPLTTFEVTPQPSHFERSEASPSLSKGETDPFRTYPRKAKISFGWSWRRAMPSSIKRGDSSSLRSSE